MCFSNGAPCQNLEGAFSGVAQYDGDWYGGVAQYDDMMCGVQVILVRQTHAVPALAFHLVGILP